MAKQERKRSSKYALKFQQRLKDARENNAFYTNDKGIKVPFPQPLMV